MNYINSNLSAEERERLAYFAGDVHTAALLDDLAQKRETVGAFENFGIYDGSDLEKLSDEKSNAEHRVSELEEELADLRGALREALGFLPDFYEGDDLEQFRADVARMLA